jgi:hypothetical protein
MLFSNDSGQLKKLSLLSVSPEIDSNHLEIISKLHQLESLELGNCKTYSKSQFQGMPFSKLAALHKLNHLRIEKGDIGSEIGALESLRSFRSLELVNVELKEGFSDGLIRLKNLKSFLLIPSYKGESAAVNSEVVDSVLSLNNLEQFILCFTKEWLDSMSTFLKAKYFGHNGSPHTTTDLIPIHVNGVSEMFSLKKLYNLLKKSLPSTQIKILKVPRSAAANQFINRNSQNKLRN